MKLVMASLNPVGFDDMMEWLGDGTITCRPSVKSATMSPMASKDGLQPPVMTSTGTLAP